MFIREYRLAGIYSSFDRLMLFIVELLSHTMAKRNINIFISHKNLLKFINFGESIIYYSHLTWKSIQRRPTYFTRKHSRYIGKGTYRTYFLPSMYSTHEIIICSLNFHLFTHFLIQIQIQIRIHVLITIDIPYLLSLHFSVSFVPSVWLWFQINVLGYRFNVNIKFNISPLKVRILLK